MKINFSRGVGGYLSYFVEVPEGWWWGGGGHLFLAIWKTREVGGGCEIPSVVGYRYFLEPHNMRSVC